jgi:para-nitrobenzyl esterase
VKTHTGSAFLGVAYAAAPVGELRWRAPLPPPPWSGVADATEYGPICPQPAGFGGAQIGMVSEDCLRLNIFSPGTGTSRLPVLVWIHGGGFVWGSAGEYLPEPFLRDGSVVVVTVGYRLGVLGFLAHPELTAQEPESGSGNYALQDITQALRWISRNIAGFGGDPGRITLCGQSSGGSLTGAALASPDAQGLFHRAILQGATCGYPIPTLAAEEQRGLRLATDVAGPVAGPAELRRIPAEELATTVMARGFTAWGPVSGGGVLPHALPKAFATGAFNAVPVLQGTNRHDMRLDAAIAVYADRRLRTEESYAKTLTHEFGPAAAGLIRAEYPVTEHGSPALAYAAATTDGLLACPARAIATLLSSRAKVYCYEFDDPEAPRLVPIPRTFPLGSYHGAELTSLFHIRGKAAELSPAQEKLQARVVSYWTAFASSGDPNHADGPHWPVFDPQGQQVMSLSPDGCAALTAFAGRHRCQFWGSLAWTPPGR